MIYVDSLRQNGWILRGHTIKSCHLISDSNLEELHSFAEKLGLHPAWFQSQSFPHYDLIPRRRTVAVKLGAKEVTNQEFVEAMNRFRSKNRKVNEKRLVLTPESFLKEHP